MIKKLLLAGAFALTMLSGSYAQVATTTAHSFFAEGDVNDYHGYSGGYTFAASGDTVVVTASKDGTTVPGYASIEVDLPSGTYNAAQGTARDIKMKVRANPPLTTASGNGQLQISLKDNNTATPGGYANATDEFSPLADVNSTWTIVTVSMPANGFVDAYNTSNCPGGTGPCKIDSTHIAGLLLAPNNNGAYTGTIEIAYIYAGDATLDGQADPTTGAVVITAPGVSDTTIAPGSTLTLSASIINPQAPITSVSFYDGANLLGTSSSTGSPYTLTWSSIAAGTYNVTAVATDNASNTVTSGVVTVNVPASLTPIDVAAGSPSGVTVATDSGFYTNGDPSVLGTLTSSYPSTSTDANGNLVVTTNKPGGTATGYDPITLIVPNSASVIVPQHAQTLKITLAATSNVNIRVAIQDANGYVTDQLVTESVTSTPQTFTISLPPSAFQDYYTPVQGGSCTPSGPGNTCTVDSTHIVQIQLVPAPGQGYYGDITIGTVYLGDTATTLQATGVAAATISSSALYPNPANSTATYNVVATGEVTATLSDLNGKVITVQNGTTGTFDVSKLTQGIYVVSYAVNGQYSSSQKLVVGN